VQACGQFGGGDQVAAVGEISGCHIQIMVVCPRLLALANCVGVDWVVRTHH
jgi:hypothetical protein